jgi:hypothetical protein
MAGVVPRTAFDVLSGEEFFAAVGKEFQAILPLLQPSVNPTAQSSTAESLMRAL